MIEFFSMGGFGFYVWMSMGVAFLLLLSEVLSLQLNKAKVIKQLKRFASHSERK